MPKIKQTGFTLVELLIVIALIAILSVAVLATINPIEQTNKAKDSTTQNDAAEVMNAYERFYANSMDYPWMRYADTPAIALDDGLVYESTDAGFGICYADMAVAVADTDATDGCNTSGNNLGALVANDELKPSFVGKAEFQSVNQADHLWTIKMPGSSGGIYVCYIPKAKANRQLTDKLYCINQGDLAAPLIKVSDDPNDNCVALALDAATWSTPTLDGAAGMFRCVPE